MSKPEDPNKNPAIPKGEGTSNEQGKDSQSQNSNPSHNNPEAEEEEFDDLEDAQTAKKVIAVSAVIMIIALIAYFLRDKIKAFVDKQRKKLDDKEREDMK